MKKYIIPFTILTLFIMSCAQPGTLTGGDKDTIPPFIKKSIPTKDGLNFQDNKIVIKFDEYFEFNKIESQFFSSPPQEEKPKFKIYGKKLIVSFKEELKDSVTYTLEFGSSVKDFNEGNMMKNLKFVFSTYDVLDTLSIAGYIKTADTDQAISDVFVMIYEKNIDSLPYQVLPEYISKTDSSGYYKIDNIKANNYKIFALKDVNNNMMYDNPDEEIAFLDSLFLPSAKLISNVDTLKAGTILFNSEDKKLIDTLQQDSILYSNKIIFSPNNISLRLFAEDNKPQFIVRNSRNFKGNALFVFNKTLINDSITISPINFTENNFCFTEKFEVQDSIIFWTSDSSIYNLDSLSFAVSYLQRDSAENLNLETDTVSLKYKAKQRDSIPFVVNNNITDVFDLFANINLQIPALVSSFDTTKIALYQLIDTLIEDTKTQKMKIVRTTNDSLILYFARPLIDSLKIIQYNNSDIKDAFSIFPNKTNDTIICKINDYEIIHTDTLKINIQYDNLTFFDVIQKFSENINLPFSNQKIKSIHRSESDLIKFVFKKPLSKNITFTPLNFTPQTDWYTTTINHNFLEFNIIDKNIILQDSLLFAINYLEYTGNTGEVFFDDSITAVFNWENQKINNAQRYENHKFRFVFNKKLDKKPKLEFINYNVNKKWFTERINSTRDTFEYVIIDKKIKKLDSLKIKVTYNKFDKYDSLNIVVDTFKLKTKKIKDNNDQTDNKTKFTIEKPIEFTFKKDSILERNYIIKHKFIADTSYKLVIDSLAFIDIFENKCDTLKKTFTMQSESYYGSLNLDLKNVGAMEYDSIKPKYESIIKIDTLIVEQYDSTIIEQIDSLIKYRIDTTFIKKLDTTFVKKQIIDSLIKEGQLVVQFITKNEEIETVLKEFIVTDDIKLEILDLAPETYYFKIIYDKNKNGKWDTGIYLEHVQPETVIYSKPFGVKSGFLTDEKWNIGKK